MGEKPYQCNICNRRFGYKHILMEHQNLHFGNRPYACNMCDKKFAARSNLIQHRTVHKRPYHCNLCNKRFDREDQLKKHLFAHPQSLLTCNVCKYAAASQTDLNKHMFEVHHPQMVEVRPTSGGGMPHKMERCTPESDHHMNGDDMSMTPPGSARSNHDALSPPIHQQDGGMYNNKGHRIDAICSQLSTSVASSTPASMPLDLHAYHGVIVKKEALDSPTESCSGGRPDSRHLSSPMSDHSSHSSQDTRSNISLQSAVEQAARLASMVSSSSSLNSLSTSVHSSGIPTTAISPMIGGDQRVQTSALPAISEVFTRRTQKIPPPFANFGVPSLLSGDTRMAMGMPRPDLPVSSMLSPPPSASYPQLGPPSTPTSPSSSTHASLNQRPTAQLPPITQVLRQTKDQAVQHSAPIHGFPSLDDVLSYYMSKGRLFKCQHCNILFYERGMYFLHASLHGNSSPWECSICHKVCSDKNEFTIHFVNQQHNS